MNPWNSAADEKNSIYIIHIFYLIDYLKLNASRNETFESDQEKNTHTHTNIIWSVSFKKSKNKKKIGCNKVTNYTNTTTIY